MAKDAIGDERRRDHDDDAQDTHWNLRFDWLKEIGQLMTVQSHLSRIDGQMLSGSLLPHEPQKS